VELYLYTFLNCALDGEMVSSSSFGRFTLEEELPVPIA